MEEARQISTWWLFYVSLIPTTVILLSTLWVHIIKWLTDGSVQMRDYVDQLICHVLPWWYAKDYTQNKFIITLLFLPAVLFLLLPIPLLIYTTLTQYIPLGVVSVVLLCLVVLFLLRWIIRIKKYNKQKGKTL